MDNNEKAWNTLQSPVKERKSTQDPVRTEHFFIIMESVMKEKIRFWPQISQICQLWSREDKVKVCLSLPTQISLSELHFKKFSFNTSIYEEGTHCCYALTKHVSATRNITSVLHETRHEHEWKYNPFLQRAWFAGQYIKNLFISCV